MKNNDVIITHFYDLQFTPIFFIIFFFFLSLFFPPFFVHFNLQENMVKLVDEERQKSREMLEEAIRRVKENNKVNRRPATAF